ncbi:hypothetical protein ACPXB5_05365 [Micromonospora arida]|uniref:hypothetical protein n=1 Tax=Micromonospora arida TaxID=2203715 RepID=UPI003CFAF236
MPGVDAKPSSDRNQAGMPDLRLGRAEVYHILAIDLAELVADPTNDRRLLQRLRATDELFDRLKEALIGQFPQCMAESENIRRRMTESLELRGKAVWTDQFLERFAPIRLPAPQSMVWNEVATSPNGRLSTDPMSPLHFVRFIAASMKMFRDGTITYVVRATLETRRSSSAGGLDDGNGPATITQAIERLDALDRLLVDNFRESLSEFFRSNEVRQAFQKAVSINGAGLELKNISRLSRDDFKRKVKEHRVVFVEKFLRSPHDKSTSSPPAREVNTQEVPLQTVLLSSSLAGLLNTASWYEHYNDRYVESLRLKEIGYRQDEIYLTDRKATVISAPGFWAGDLMDQKPPDPLSRYKYDVVLAVEYNIACLAYFSSTLAYFQEHPDVHGLENQLPGDALPHVIDGRSILSRIEESLDLSLLVDHGFTRVFIKRLREELGLDTAIGFIRRRVEDTSTSVSLKSSVLAAEQTSKESLQAAIKNNQIQNGLAKWAIAAVIVSVLVFIGDKVADLYLRREPAVIVCVPGSNLANTVCGSPSQSPSPTP